MYVMRILHYHHRPLLRSVPANISNNWTDQFAGVPRLFPKILVIHLNRFSATERFGNKLNVTVYFLKEGLDMSNYTDIPTI